MKFEIGEINMLNGSVFATVAEFNNGFSHIAVDDDCWVIINGHDKHSRISPYIFAEAKAVLDQLPNRPSAYQPYRNYLNGVTSNGLIRASERAVRN